MRNKVEKKGKKLKKNAEKGSICHDERVAYRPFFVVSGIPMDGATRPERAEAPSPGQRPGYM